VLRKEVSTDATRSWRRAVLVLFAVAAGTNVPTPLLLIYKDSLGLSAETLTALFGVYAAGLVPSLLMSGGLSDRFGRRRVVLPFVVLSGLASLLFIAAADSVWLLFVARFLQGVVSGAVFTVGSAWVGELSAGDGSGARRAAMAQSAGFSLGPLTSGLLGQYAPWPTTLPYLVHVVLVAVALSVGWVLAETVTPSLERRSSRDPLLLKEDRWRFFTVAAPVAVCVYAFPSVVISALPVLVDLPHATAVAITGVLAGLTLGASTLAAQLQKRLGAATPIVGAAAGVAGFLIALVAAQHDAVALLVPGALLLGAGGGLSFASGLAMVAELALPSRRGALTGVFLACAYLGFAAPFATAVAADAHGTSLPLGVAAGLSGLLVVRLLIANRRTTKGRTRTGPAPS
jgi:MFS family permease